MATTTVFDNELLTKFQDRATETVEGAQDRLVELNETIAEFLADRMSFADKVPFADRLPLADKMPTPKDLFDKYWAMQSKALSMQSEMIERNKVFAERLLAAWEPKPVAKPAAKPAAKKSASA
ncbi:MAG: hypothetical protein KDB21_14495 [Acidimicrobiales bacterium]|nr:hypothetical protein [Acidimicrobiales bacterium]